MGCTGLTQRPSVVIANKMDADRPDDPLATRNLALLRARTSLPVVPVSAMRGEGIGTLTDWLRATVETLRAAAPHRVDAATGVRLR
jgi:50S ribosomal subunit-associated GTPase HflX